MRRRGGLGGGGELRRRQNEESLETQREERCDHRVFPLPNTRILRTNRSWLQA